MGRVVRVIFGFLVACLAAGISMVLFVYTPSELIGDMAGERLTEAMLLSLAAATQTIKFAALFALIGIIIGEGRQITGWAYYALIGIAIAMLGFLDQYASEARGAASIFNRYALTAFLVTGAVAGTVYWWLAGRSAGGPKVPVLEAADPPRPMPVPKPVPPARTAAEPT